MRIVCPSCEAAYDVPAPVLAKRRKLRCARCNTDWIPEAAPAAPAAPVETAADALPAAATAEPLARARPAAPEPELFPPVRIDPMPAPVAPQPAVAPAYLAPADAAADSGEADAEADSEADSEAPGRRSRSALPVIAAWVVSFALLGAMGWSLITWRGAIMHAWPASARLYVALGYLS